MRLLKQSPALAAMALAIRANVAAALNIPSLLWGRQSGSSDGGNMKVTWALADVSFVLGQSATILYNVSLPDSQAESQMYFFLLKTSDPTSVSAANTAEVLRLPEYCVDDSRSGGQCQMSGPPGSIIQESTVLTLQTFSSDVDPNELQNFFLCMSNNLDTPVCQPDTYSPLFAVNAPAPGKPLPTTMFPSTPLTVTTQTSSLVSLLGNPSTVPVSAVETFVPQVTIGPSGTSTYMTPLSMATQNTVTSTMNATMASTTTDEAESAMNTQKTAPTKQASSNSSGGLSTAAKVGIAIAAIGGLGLLALLVLCCIRHRKRMPKLPKSGIKSTSIKMSRPRLPKIPMSIKIRHRNESPIENLMEKTMKPHSMSGDMFAAEKLEMMHAISNAEDEDDSLYGDHDSPPPMLNKHSAAAVSALPSPALTPALIPGFTPTKGMSPLAAAAVSPKLIPHPSPPQERRYIPSHKRNMSSLSIGQSSHHSRARSATGDLLTQAGLTLEQQSARACEKITYGKTRRGPPTVVHQPSPNIPPSMHFGSNLDIRDSVASTTSPLSTRPSTTISLATVKSSIGSRSRSGSTSRMRSGTAGEGSSLGASRPPMPRNGVSSFLNVPFIGLSDPNMSAEELAKYEEEERQIDAAIEAAEKKGGWRVATPRSSRWR